MNEHYYYHIDYRLSKKHDGPHSADYNTRRNLLRKLSIYEREEWDDIENDDFATSTLDVLSSKEIGVFASEDIIKGAKLANEDYIRILQVDKFKENKVVAIHEISERKLRYSPSDAAIFGK